MKMYSVAGVAVLALALSTSAQGEDQKEMRALLDKAIAAQGGEKTLVKHKASVESMKGTIETQGMTLEYTGTWSIQLPDLVRNEMTLEVGGQQITQTTVITKTKGWVSVNGMTMEMPKKMFETARNEMHSGFVCAALYPLKDAKTYTLSSVGEVEVEKKPAIGMRVTRKGYVDVILYFDKKTHLLLKSESRTIDFAVGEKEVDSIIYFGDYKKVGKSQVAHKVRLERNGKVFLKGTVTEYEALESLDASTFEKP